MSAPADNSAASTRLRLLAFAMIAAHAPHRKNDATLEAANQRRCTGVSERPVVTGVVRANKRS
ncbi:MAG TPA: hypothetical protein PLQ43_08070, partial [Deltaproteobacteria bacterium]|nr:hypothetical protein [Deltaproteobacteria bacterium]